MSARVLLVDDEARLREMIGILLRRQGHEVLMAEGAQAALGAISEAPFDAVITDLRMPDGSGLDVLEAVQEESPGTQVIVLTAYATTGHAVEAMRRGAYDFLEKPFTNDVLVATLDKALEKRAIIAENAALRAQVRGGDVQLIGVSAAMQALRDLIARAASARTSVLVTGESGTGKELVARALHERGERREAPFVVVNCGALPEALMESELFGHEKGAFTGAGEAKEGLVRAAESGTLFLDEIGELPMSLQVKLLRVLQERRVRPVGASDEREVDVRVVAATNRELEREVEAQTFREDLFYRLNVIRLKLPALRKRPEDIRPLAEHLLTKHNGLQGRRLTLSEEAMGWLCRQPFPGNVRELENRVERAVALAAGPQIAPADLGAEAAGPASLPPAALELGEQFDLEGYLAEAERKVLLAALEKAEGNRTKAAKLLGISFRSCRYRLAKLLPDLDSEDGERGP